MSWPPEVETRPDGAHGVDGGAYDIKGTGYVFTSETGIRNTARGILWVAAAVIFLALSPGFGGAEEESLSYTLQLPPARAPAVAWGRDPFVPLIADAEMEASDMLLTAIFYHTESPSAIINADIVYVGSTVNGQKVIDIGKTHVILQGVSGRTRLEIVGLPRYIDAH